MQERRDTMKGYERRAAGKERYCNLDIWDASIGCWTKSKRQYDSEQDARNAATKGGRYRISVTENGQRTEGEPFEK